MLVEVICDKFRNKSIPFHAGLNVVVGDEKATNSIGKSSLLMVLDFIFGGESLLKYNADIIQELGDHEYCFSFAFGNDKYFFKRGTYVPDIVYKCDGAYKESDPLSIDEYRSLLKSSYKLEDIDLTFRATVSLFSRIWGKENDDVKRPLHSYKNKKSTECIDDLLKLFKQYESIKILSLKAKYLAEERSAIRNAFKQKIIPRITKTKYKENIKLASKIDDEIQGIKKNLAKYAVNISEIVNREVAEMKEKKDSLLRERGKVSFRLNRIRNDILENRHVKSKMFYLLAQYFPEVDEERVTKVEEFHSKISKILKKELKESEARLADALARIDGAIAELDQNMAKTFSRIEQPEVIIDRVFDLSNVRSSVESEIRYFENDNRVDAELKDIKKSLANEKARVEEFVQNVINGNLRKLVHNVYGEGRRIPLLKISQNSYTFYAVEDTGTGKAYSNLVLFDLSVFEATSLPFIIHDSFLFKNIENDAVAKMIDIYVSSGKQSFIAIDEIKKYGEKAEKTIRDNMVIQLTNDEVLYVKDWRK